MLCSQVKLDIESGLGLVTTATASISATATATAAAAQDAGTGTPATSLQSKPELAQPADAPRAATAGGEPSPEHAVAAQTAR